MPPVIVSVNPAASILPPKVETPVTPNVAVSTLENVLTPVVWKPPVTVVRPDDVKPPAIVCAPASMPLAKVTTADCTKGLEGGGMGGYEKRVGIP